MSDNVKKLLGTDVITTPTTQAGRFSTRSALLQFRKDLLRSQSAELLSAGLERRDWRRSFPTFSSSDAPYYEAQPGWVRDPVSKRLTPAIALRETRSNNNLPSLRNAVPSGEQDPRYATRHRLPKQPIREGLTDCLRPRQVPDVKDDILARRRQVHPPVDVYRCASRGIPVDFSDAYRLPEATPRWRVRLAPVVSRRRRPPRSDKRHRSTHAAAC